MKKLLGGRAQSKPISSVLCLPRQMTEAAVEKKRRKKTVLEEEEYLNEMGRIISRDFFPLLENEEALPLSLDKFAANYTSEDNESFDVLAKEASDDHVRSHWWAYGAKRLADAGVEQPRLGQHEPNHQPRSTLFFSPQPPAVQEASKDGNDRICAQNPRCRRRRTTEAAVASHNTRFRGSKEGSDDEEDDDLSSIPSLQSSLFHRTRNETAKCVQMTPDPNPRSPLVTWGTLAAPPRTLSETREQIARSLDAEAKRRKRVPTPSPLRQALDASPATTRSLAGGRRLKNSKILASPLFRSRTKHRGYEN